MCCGMHAGPHMYTLYKINTSVIILRKNTTNLKIDLLTWAVLIKGATCESMLVPWIAKTLSNAAVSPCGKPQHMRKWVFF